MEKGRTKRSIINIGFNFANQIITLALSFISRTVFIHTLGVEYLGINGLFTNILTILALAELGLDSSVVYTLYKPVSENNYPLIHSLLSYFKKIYYSITVLILVIGLALIPFLRFIISTDLPFSDVVIYYVLFLINNVASYFVAHKVALISAFQEQRIQKIISLATTGFLQIAHIIVLFVARNYFVYVATTLVFTFINNLIISVVCKRRYRAVFENNEIVTFDKKSILDRIKSAFLYKIGAVAVNNTDNILISALVSVRGNIGNSIYAASKGAINSLVYSLSQEFLDSLITKEFEQSQEASAKSTQRQNNKVNDALKIYEKGSAYWQALLDAATRVNLLSFQDISLLKIAIEIKTTGRLPSDKQTKAIYSIEKRINDAGIFVGE